MTSRCSRAAVAVAACTSIGSPLVGQAIGTLDIGASLIEYEGFLVSGAAVVSPALYFNAPNLSMGVQGAWTVFESGNQIWQGSAAAAWIAPSRRWWSVELAGSMGAAKYADAEGYGHALARTRLHVFGARAGGWVSGSLGGSFGGTARTPFELEVGGWSVGDRFTVAGSLKRTWLDSDGYVDLLGAARWAGSRLEVEGRAGVRPWAESGGGVGDAQTGVYGDASALLSLNRRILVQLSGGTYPSDPVRRTLGATYLSVGIRLNVVGAQPAPMPAVTRAMIRAAREHAVSDAASPARLEVAPVGHPRTIRVHVRDAASVELMGDFTDWQAIQLTQTGATTWEIRLPLARGVHRVNVRVDGGRWLVPAGTRLQETEFGVPVGIVVIP